MERQEEEEKSAKRKVLKKKKKPKPTGDRNGNGKGKEMVPEMEMQLKVRRSSLLMPRPQRVKGATKTTTKQRVITAEIRIADCGNAIKRIRLP